MEQQVTENSFLFFAPRFFFQKQGLFNHFLSHVTHNNSGAYLQLSTKDIVNEKKTLVTLLSIICRKSLSVRSVLLTHQSIHTGEML